MTEFPTKPLLHLSRCVLRPYHAVDKHPMHLLANNLKVTHYMRDSFPQPYTEKSAATWLHIARAEGLEKTGENPAEVETTEDAKPEGGGTSAPAGDPSSSKESSKPRPAQCPPTELHLAVCLPDGTFVGSIGLMTTGSDRTERHVREIGYWVGEPYWGRGIARDAAAGLARWALSDETADEAAKLLSLPAGERLERVVACISVGNVGSTRAIEHAGFVHEGTMRRAFRKRDEIHDIRLYSMIRTDLEGQSV